MLIDQAVGFTLLHQAVLHLVTAAQDIPDGVHHLLLVCSRVKFYFNLCRLGLIVKQLLRHIQRHIDEVSVITVLLQLEEK